MHRDIIGFWVLVLLAVIAWVIVDNWSWIEWHLGFANGEGNNSHYLFPSGAGSIIERVIELVVIGGLLWHKNNCHKQGCWSIGKYPAIEGGGWHYCKKHHNTNGVHE